MAAHPCEGTLGEISGQTPGPCRQLMFVREKMACWQDVAPLPWDAANCHRDSKHRAQEFPSAGYHFPTQIP